MSNNKQSGDVLVNIDEASKITNYSRHTLYQKVSQNQIPYIKKTGEKRLWFNKEELLNYCKKPSQNKKNKVKNEMRVSEKLSDAQKNFVMRAVLEYWQTLPYPFSAMFIDYGAMKQHQTIKTMSNNKQSSVELFAIALYEGGFLQGNGDEINDLLEHHKAMHKEEVMKATWKGLQYYEDGKVQYVGEQYYNETFGGNNEQQ